MAKVKTNTAYVEAYLHDADLQGLTKDTCDRYRSSLGIFLEYLGSKSVVAVGLDELRGFLGRQKKQGLRPATLGGQFSAVSSFYEYLAFDKQVAANPVPGFRKRYFPAITRDANKDQSGQRQLLAVDDMRRLVHNITEVRDRAFLVLLCKTGARRNELTAIDLEDIDWKDQSIALKPRPKRTNCTVFFDDETARVLHRWLAVRTARGAEKNGPLFIGDQGRRIQDEKAAVALTQAAEAIGLHDPKGPLRRKFTPHCCRHFFTTHLRRAGMSREHLAWLRGDAGSDTLDIYMHVDPAEVRESYRARVPQFGL